MPTRRLGYDQGRPDHHRIIVNCMVESQKSLEIEKYLQFERQGRGSQGHSKKYCQLHGLKINIKRSKIAIAILINAIISVYN